MHITPQKASTIIRILKKMLWHRKLRVVSIIVLGFLAGLFGSVGISALIPVFSLLTNQQYAQLDSVTKGVKLVFDTVHIPFSLPFLILSMAGLFILKALVQFLAKYLNEKTAAEYEEDLRNNLFEKTLNSSWPHLMSQKVGYLEKTLIKDVYVTSTIINSSSSLILLSTSFIMYAIVAFNISAKITIITTMVGATIFIILKPVAKIIKRLSSEANKTEKEMAHFINENTISAKAIKTSGLDEKIILLGQEYFRRFRENRKNAAFYQYLVGSMTEPIGLIFIAFVFLFYHQSPDFKIASFAVIIYLIQKMFSFMQSGQSIVLQFSDLIPYFQSIVAYNKQANDNKEDTGGNKQFSLKEKIEFKNIFFSYNAEREVLSNLNFTIKKGEMIGLIGSSGTGKTTVVDVLLRLFKPESGEILIDDVNATEIDIKSWRKNIGYVSQDIFMINDSIRNNIKFYEDIPEAEIIEATKHANIYEFIQGLPQGLNTVIGERGVKISGGQKQRIALARVLARRPQVLVLDEATSSLDGQSEAMIQNAIEKLKGDVTVFAIAHRLSTITKSDRLLVLDNGKIIEEGNPQELLSKQDSHFYKMYHINK